MIGVAPVRIPSVFGATVVSSPQVGTTHWAEKVDTTAVGNARSGINAGTLRTHRVGTRLSFWLFLLHAVSPAIHFILWYYITPATFSAH